MEIHHSKHHQAYVTNLNAALTKDAPDLLTKPIEAILADGEVDAVDTQGRDLNFSGCEIMSYALVTSMGVDPISYAG